MTVALQIDLPMAQSFLDALDADREFTFQTFDDAKPPRPELAQVLHGTLEQQAATLRSLNERGAGVFVMINQGDLLGRRADNVLAVRALFVDLDGARLAPVVEAATPPSIVVASSPGRWHAYWPVDGCPLEQFGPTQKSLAMKFDGDASVCDLPRVMRLPGFYHWKTAQPILVTATIGAPL